MIQKVYELICDGCMTLLVHAYSIDEAKRLFKKYDYKTKAGKHYCPDCQANL